MRREYEDIIERLDKIIELLIEINTPSDFDYDKHIDELIEKQKKAMDERDLSRQQIAAGFAKNDKLVD